MNWEQMNELRKFFGLWVASKPVGQFYGSDGNSFKLNEDVFEVVEDESDGYRSCLGAVRIASPGKLIFFSEPIDEVELVEVEGKHETIYQLKSTKDGHIWLSFGTENEDDYYPCFVYRYTPRETVMAPTEVKATALLDIIRRLS